MTDTTVTRKDTHTLFLMSMKPPGYRAVKSLCGASPGQ